MKPQAAARSTTIATVLEESYHRTLTALGHLLEGLLRAVTVALAAVAVVAHDDAGGGGSSGGSSSHGAGRRAGGGGDRGGRGHADSHVTDVSCGGYDARRRIEEI
jgi:uncharacterized membrane protein YgcG